MARPTTALIVDDESHVRAFLRLLLQELKITTCWEAADGASAIQLAQENRPELVLLDINLPGMNGLQVLAQLKELDDNMLVVMVTAQGSVSTVQEAVRLGAAGYVLKHSPKDQTLATLRDVVDGEEE